MAADQWKKRMNAVTVVGCSQDQNGSKKRRLGVTEFGFKMRCNVSLVWDEKKKCVVPKRNQICISWRDIIPFYGSVPHHHSILADVVTVPQEIFDLDNLAEVLSHEVWQTCLSDNERSLLIKFLPRGTDAPRLVHDLLGGDNFHFGNPFLQWSRFLCSGNLHPDGIIRHHQSIKSHKKAYYMELQNYHVNMIENLKTWRDKWVSCRNFDEQIVKILRRSKKPHGKRGHILEFDAEENLVITPEYSWAAGDKDFSSDSPNPSVLQGASERSMDNQYGNSLDWSDMSKHNNGEQLQKCNIQQIDGSKYMSYIKVSKEHYQRIKNSLKHNSNSIHSRALNNVLGNIENLHVKPFEAYEEEEKQKLHEHWMQLAKRDLPEHYSNWLKRQLKKGHVRDSICHEIKAKLRSLSQDSLRVFYDLKSMEMISKEVTEIAPTLTAEGVEDDEEGTPNRFLLHPIDNNDAGDHSSSIVLVEEEETDEPICMVQEKVHFNTATTIKGDSWSSSSSEPYEQVHQMVPLSVTNEFYQLDPEPCDDDIIKKIDKESPSVSESLNKDALNQGSPLSSNNSIWPVTSMPRGVFKATSMNDEYRASVELLPLSHPQVMDDRASHFVEGLSCKKEIGKERLHGESNNVSFIGSYHDDRSDGLQSFIEGDSPGSVHNKQEHSSLTFHPRSANLIAEPSQFSGSLVLRQGEHSDLYMQHQDVLGNEYSVGGTYPFPRRHGNLNVAMPDWDMNSIRMPAAQISNPNGCGDVLLGQNWFSGENRERGVWSSLESRVGQSQCTNGNASDQSLFSVVSECNELCRGISYDTVGSTERFMLPRNYGPMGIQSPSGANTQQPPGNNLLLTYLSSHEASVSFPTTNHNMGWVNNASNQSSGLQDSLAKPYF
ncbi:hypothetical protein DM860_016199 [Cuscuta australis]|uniref:DEUBAD domain-containing protein n=1 Tax=Cuscuta australis TaxID=267555 RepID=A0A328DU10_9ASTE|nr:hypothetical protein DM860_016199 [Cuscuta australis]